MARNLRRRVLEAAAHTSLVNGKQSDGCRLLLSSLYHLEFRVQTENSATHLGGPFPSVNTIKIAPPNKLALRPLCQVILDSVILTTSNWPSQHWLISYSL